MEREECTEKPDDSIPPTISPFDKREPNLLKRFFKILGPGLINFMDINPMKALFWTAVINGFLAPPLLVVIMLVANNKEAMRDSTNSLWTNTLGWATVTVMFGAAIASVLTLSKP